MTLVNALYLVDGACWGWSLCAATMWALNTRPWRKRSRDA